MADRLTEPLNAFGEQIGSEWLATHNVGEDRYVVFGAALVLMMLLRPGGLFPSKQRAAEIAEVKNVKRTPVTNAKAFYWQFGQYGGPGLTYRLSDEIGRRLDR